MPRDRHAPGSAQDWLARARGDLALARAPLPEGGFHEDLCFHAQQAAEKAVKAAYQSHGWPFVYTHDLVELLAGLKSRGVAVPRKVEDAAALTAYAWESRYPGLTEPVSADEYREAVAHAETVVAWAGQMLADAAT